MTIFDDSYSFCYYYTVVAWNTVIFDVSIDQGEGLCSTGAAVNIDANFFKGFNDNTSTALTTFPTFLHGSIYNPESNTAVLPGGYGFKWSSCDDHHLLQVGYSMGAPELFLKSGKYQKGADGVVTDLEKNFSRFDSGFVSWNTQAIFKDNDSRRGYEFLELVSGMSGADIGIIIPPYNILPKEDENSSNCVSPGISDEEFTVEHIPFAYAIPVLTGWEIGYLCDDEHLKELRIGIEIWNYKMRPEHPRRYIKLYYYSSI